MGARQSQTMPSKVLSSSSRVSPGSRPGSFQTAGVAVLQPALLYLREGPEAGAAWSFAAATTPAPTAPGPVLSRLLSNAWTRLRISVKDAFSLGLEMSFVLQRLAVLEPQTCALEAAKTLESL